MNLKPSCNEHTRMFLVAIISVVVSAFLASGRAETVTYYIKPLGNSSCPAVPCLTLSDYVSQRYHLVDTSQTTTLVFLTGMHTLKQTAHLQNFSFYAMIGDSSSLPQLKSVITCSGDVGFHFEGISSVRIHSMAFHSCGVHGQAFQSVVQVYHSNLKITFSSFQHNILKSPLFLLFSEALFSNCSFTDNTAERVKGGAFKSISSNVTFIGSNSFVNNSVCRFGGAIYARNCTIIMIATNGQPAYYTAYTSMNMMPEEASNIFLHNKIIHDFHAVGGVMHAHFCGLNFSGKVIAVGNLIVPNENHVVSCGVDTYNNMARQYRATIYIASSTLNLNGHLNVTRNKGGVFFIDSMVLINGTSTISHNYGFYWATIFLFHSTLTLWGNCVIEDNMALFVGGLALKSSIAIFINSTVSASRNTAFYGSLVLFHNSILFIAGTSIFTQNRGVYGTAISVYQSTLILQGNCISDNNSGLLTLGSIALENSTARFVNLTMTVSKNKGIFGGGLTLLHNSTVVINGSSTFRENFGLFGAAISVLESTLTLQGNCIIEYNKALYSGGGIFMSQSSVVLAELIIHLSANSAKLGAGFYLQQSSRLVLERSLQLETTKNRARRGAAIYVNDICPGMLPIKQQCFLQFQAPSQENLVEKYSFIFSSNTASIAGDILYGGMLDNCAMNHKMGHNALSTFMSVSTFNESLESNLSSISSDPFSVCFCTNYTLDCDRSTEIVEVQRGQTFTVPLVAIGQGNGTVQAVVRTQFKSANLPHTGLAKNQAIQQGEKYCWPLHYTVFSAEDSIELTVFAEGPCRDLGKAGRTIQVHLLPCPIGFQLSGGECICHPIIQHYTNTCLAEKGVIVRWNNWWISTVYSNGSLEGFVTHSHCPFDYCKQPMFLLDLNHPDDQCAINRLGTLCGGCQYGLSLTLGGSTCSKCGNKYLPVMLLVFIVAGIVLILTLLLLQLNVAMGTINGLVFYANIVSINKAVFFPAGDTNILTVFISWLNLDFGIKTCFYSGLDMYAKVWLQFVFPAYIWLLLAIIIIGCHYSTKLSKLFGRNPVACLSTLILLSYTKLLQTIITVLAFTIIQYPNGTRKAVWLHDANIAYLQGKHIPLFLVAVCALLFLFIPYTLILTTGQWIQAKSNWRVLRPLNSLYLRPFFDAYYAPFKPQHRYWPGGMLLLRLILLLVFSLNISGNISYNLLIISTSVLGLCNMHLLTGKVYTHWALDLLEVSFFFNLGLLSVSTYHVVLSEGNQAAVVYISVGLAFVQFIGIILYHSYLPLKKLAVWKKLSGIFNIRYFIHREGERVGTNNIEMEAAPPVVPTTTMCVSLREPLLDSGNL